MASMSRSKLWSIRNYRSMFSAYALASFGDWFDALAIQVLVVYRWGIDPFLIALIPVCMALPSVLFSSFAGTLADRVQQAKLMMFCDLLTVLLTVGVLFAPNFAWLLPLLALRAMAGVFHVPAQQALTRRVVPADLLLQATSYNGLVGQGSKVAGPLLGAVTLAALSPQACIVINMGARLLSALLLLGLWRAPQNSAVQEEKVAAKGRAGKQSFWSEWKEGWVFLWHHKVVFHTVLFGFVGLAAILMVDYQFPTLFKSISPQDESLTGQVVAAIGAGAVGVILLLNRLDRISYGWGLGGGCGLIGVGVALLGLCPPGSHLLWLLGFGLLIGVGNGAYILAQNYILQKETSPEVVGRVFGIQNTMNSLVMLTAPLAGGLLIRAVSVGTAFMSIGVVMLVLGLLGVLFRRLLWPHTEAAAIGSPASESVTLNQTS
ncbi:putative MFS family arabinose efflux permease [Fontibacillus phaseoli]|uniref:Putative MFS family arabinose efflux permease n=1 Tax=Fontibacillus phaseoli TaxID=1416533 RepID=A0A369B9U5_9BACL|nr:MFS transporter [Fontibacillus phaseoli]RCX16454.1 putative MFS family arabinose efflux permease [Fontibacillus phaseoli]